LVDLIDFVSEEMVVVVEVPALSLTHTQPSLVAQTAAVPPQPSQRRMRVPHAKSRPHLSLEDDIAIENNSTISTAQNGDQIDL
jgi:hypothetical protein